MVNSSQQGWESGGTSATWPPSPQHTPMPSAKRWAHAWCPINATARPLPSWRAGQVGLGPPGGLIRDVSLALFRSVNAGPNHMLHYQIQQQFSPESDNQEEEAFPTAWAQIRKDHLHPPRPPAGPPPAPAASLSWKPRG